jgi:hypothetical protein
LDSCVHQTCPCNHPHHRNAIVMIYIAHYHNGTVQECNSDVLQETASVIY